MSRRKQRSAFDQVFEFDRGRIVAYRDCGLSFREIGSRVGLNQTTVMRICDRLDAGGTTDVSAANGTMKEGCGWQNEMKLSLLTSHASVCNTTMVGFESGDNVESHRGERMLNSCVMHRHTGPAPGIMVLGGIEYHSRTPLVRIAGTLNSQRYICEFLEPVVFPCLQGLATAIIQQFNARPHAARSPDLSPIENMWSMVAQRLTQITPPAATPDQLWQLVEAAWSAVPQEHIQSLFESVTRHVAAVISNNVGYSGY
ncbi:transposable element Tcb1 transposase [Trichonephila clavipes]|nr:transposable element Tcb1 transposase [Trichonephila clavipes]